MNKKVKSVLQGILFILIIIAFIYVGTKDFNIEENEFLKDYEKLEKMQILEKRENKICFSEASYALLIYFVNKEERTLNYIKEVIGI